jgi:hypothetical protein
VEVDMRKYVSILILIVILVVTFPTIAQANHSFITRPSAISTPELGTDAGTSMTLSWGASAGAVSYIVRWSTSDYPSDNESGTLGYSGTQVSANITGLSPDTTTYFSIFAVAHSGSLWSYSTPAHVLREYGGWEGISKIYWNPAQEDANNPYLETAADELQDYLGRMGLTTSTTNNYPAAPAIYLSVNATQLLGYGDETFRLVKNGNGVTITGKTPIAVRWGAYYLLDEKLGVRWFEKSDAWTVVPTSLISLNATDEIHEPDYVWRYPWMNSATGTPTLTSWLTHNRLYGSKYYDVMHSYGYIFSYGTGGADLETYWDAHPGDFLPNTGYQNYPWQLLPTASDVISWATAYALNMLSGTATMYNDILPVGAVSISPNDGTGWDPPYSDDQDITDTAFGLANDVAENITGTYPNAYVALYSYADASEIPSITIEPNVISFIASLYNYSDNTNAERVIGTGSTGASLGWRDYINVFPATRDLSGIKIDVVNSIKWLNSQGVKYYSGEDTDSWGGGNGINNYLVSKMLWDSSLNIDDLLDDFYTKAFGAAANHMRDYYEHIASDNVSLKVMFDDLDAAETAAYGDSATLARIRHEVSYAYFCWQYHNVSIANMAQSDEQDFYTFLCKTRDWFIANYNDGVSGGTVSLEGIVRASLKSRFGMTDGQVNALQNFATPTDGMVDGWLADGVSEFGGNTNAVPINPRFLNLEALGNTEESPTTPITANERDIMVYSSGGENVTVSAKTGGTFKIGWYNPDGIMVARWEQDTPCDWTNHNFPAVEAGYYYLTTYSTTTYTQVDVADKPAVIVASNINLFNPEKETNLRRRPRWTGAVEQYLYVPAGTSKFTFTSTVANQGYHVIGSLTDPNDVAHNFNFAGDTLDPITEYYMSSLTINSPTAGLWRLDINSNPAWNFMWLDGIPPLMWHDPEYLLVPSG